MLSMDNNNQSTNRSNSVVTGGMEDEAKRISSPSVFVPSMTDTDLNTTTAQPNGKDTIKVVNIGNRKIILHDMTILMILKNK